MANEKILGITGFCLVVLMVLGVLMGSFFLNSPVEQVELDFTVSGSNECLRFLTRDVAVIYVPFVVGAGEHWDLFVECTRIATPGGWVDLYLYNEYWDEGVDYKCFSEDIYSILDDVESLDFKLGLETPFAKTFEGSVQKSYTFFFIFPPGGPSTFHVSLKEGAEFLPMIKTG